MTDKAYLHHAKRTLRNEGKPKSISITGVRETLGTSLSEPGPVTLGLASGTAWAEAMQPTHPNTTATRGTLILSKLTEWLRMLLSHVKFSSPVYEALEFLSALPLNPSLHKESFVFSHRDKTASISQQLVAATI